MRLIIRAVALEWRGLSPASFLFTLRSLIERRESSVLTDEYRYKILKLVEANPEVSQRELARELGISLGKANYCLKALIDVGLVKAHNFRNNKNKLAYMYLLTPTGIEEKASITMRFLKHKIQEREALLQEIEELRREAAQLAGDVGEQ